MNEETELTVVPDPAPGKRPAKKAVKAMPGVLVTSKKKFAPGKSGSKTSAGKSASVKTAPKKKSVVKKAGSWSKPKTSVKAGASKKSAVSVPPTGGGEKPGKSATKKTANSDKTGSTVQPAGNTRKSISQKSGSTSGKAKTLGKSSSAVSTLAGSTSTADRTAGRKPRTPAPLPEGLDVSTLKPWKNYGITRVAQVEKKNFGFYVRVRGITGTAEGRTEEFFSDKKNGGEAKALKAATARRNELFQSLPDVLKYRASKPTRRKSKSAA